MKFKNFIEEGRLSNRCVGKIFVFTGFRSVGMTDDIEEQGGKVGNTVTYETTHLIMKKLDSGSGKESKAIDLGVCIWSEQQMEKFLAGEKIKENRGYAPVKG
jgi:DNA ligase (NAD+)